jgi:hypothetical protein
MAHHLHDLLLNRPKELLAELAILAEPELRRDDGDAARALPRLLQLGPEEPRR